ncbi:putative acetyltransferase [Altererythrobacter atlanticus]|uniref:Acetyltransferase (GNAT) family protein n=1 Tax=Croceibacterium atlanticum TaxID=1267766 RepID=A0A0F7KRM7_9SPHN|nr:N-acetyltransferase [Croceibacterium atlanticum]AKH43123.1 Acetyltransferase (GNAT) family protein [Croceibacterium atlanticum]MBB5732173.1 putative acetyltransferase [Croceibacterium atlanticum]
MRCCLVRSEQPGDEAPIGALTEAAFSASRHGHNGEKQLVEQLRISGDLALSLVAVNMDLAIIGHCAFSPVSFSDETPGWFALGPISVIPLRQHSGIGSNLLEEGLERLRQMGARGCIVVGDPEFYGRFGFAHDPALTLPILPDQDQEYLLRLTLEGPPPKGTVQLAPAFYELG